jgi:general secretion pathway protein E
MQRSLKRKTAQTSKIAGFQAFPISLDISYMRLGELLVAKQLVSQADVDRALKFQSQFEARLGAVLVRLGALSEDALLPVIAEQLLLPLHTVSTLPADRGSISQALARGRLSAEWLRQNSAIVWLEDDTVHCAARAPQASLLQETINNAFASQSVHWALARTGDIAQALTQLETKDFASNDAVEHLREMAEEAPVIELVNNLIAQAVDERASDIHIEPEDITFVVRYRVDGLLQTRQILPRERFDAVVSRIKLVSALDIAERRLPQDGRFSTRAGGLELDVRVSAIPSKFGESIVMRLLPKNRSDVDLAKLGLAKDHLSTIHRWIKEPNGIVLVTGPTGSGKSTTLYSALAQANDRQRKIITVEDPIEYKMNGIVQIQAHSDIGYTFARALRSILRHDPDVIMVGEIRDKETAEIAIQAALTGHMVFSTLHTNSAIASFGRLLDMGIEPFLVVSALRAVVAQRLVRTLCSKCSVPHQPKEIWTQWFAQQKHQGQRLFSNMLPDSPNWRKPVGCPSCSNTGFAGRVGIYEVVEVDEALRELVLKHASSDAMQALVDRSGVRSMRDDGLIKAVHGLTTIDEVFRVTGEEMLEAA